MIESQYGFNFWWELCLSIDCQFGIIRFNYCGRTLIGLRFGPLSTKFHQGIKDWSHMSIDGQYTSSLGLIFGVGLFIKPQDSFGKKDKTFSWSAESAAHRKKTLINLPALVLNDVFSCNNVKWLNIAMYITYGGVFGGTPNILIFGLFLENESNLEWTMNRAFIVHTDLLNHVLTKKINLFQFFVIYSVPKLSCGFKQFMG